MESAKFSVSGWKQIPRERRRELVDSIVEEVVLAQIAKCDDDCLIAMSAVGRITDELLLFGIAESAKESLVAIRAVEGISDQCRLFEIAKNASDMVGSHAVERITDQSLLVEIATNARAFLARGAAVEMLTDQQALAGIAKREGDFVIASRAVARITDQSLLSEIATNAKDGMVGGHAVERITDQLVLFEFAANARNFDVRRAAIEMLTDQQALAHIAERLDYALVGGAAVERITDESLLAQVAKNAKSPEGRGLADAKLRTVQRRNRRRFNKDTYMYTEYLAGWEIDHSSDLVRELGKLNAGPTVNDGLLLDGVRIKPMKPEYAGQRILVRGFIVCPKCSGTFNHVQELGTWLGSGPIQCSNCRFWFDIHEDGSHPPHYYLYCHTYVGKPYDIREVPKPTVNIDSIDVLQT